ncbi:MAG: RNA-binding protein [Fusicatenibacter sp.]|nr:YlmH/Sll1252 family protein [Fusicatenibacter sp.]
MEEEQLLPRRIADLANQCYYRDVPTHTEFLNLSEQDLFYRTVAKMPGVRYVLYGGYEMAERRAALFLPSYGEEGDSSLLPITYVKIRPLNDKFAEDLTHRDFLGSLMNLGIERGKTGDILLDGKTAYLVCMEDMAEYLCQELKRVRHTSVYCEQTGQLPEKIGTPVLQRKEGTVASVRLDAVLALAFSTSRSKLVPLIDGGQVYINGRQILSASAVPKEGDIISVRHMGRFIYRGIKSETKKGRLYAIVDRYASAAV